ncbi:MAG TPA: hypothetical protein PKE29_04835 [Phycisphaerales bacterium]|nr:hypothetical protein [Phycisphaerales bacterium]
MKPHPRIRKTIKWGGAAVTVLLVVVWAGSRWWNAGYEADRWVVGAVGGRLHLSTYAPGSTAILGGWYVLRQARRFEGWQWGFSHDVFGYLESWAVPMWPLPLLSGASALLAWRLDTLARRARLGRCPKCNYDRTGLSPAAVCPECGKGPTS